MNRNSEPESNLTPSEMEFTTLGSYEPGFFHLRLNTCEDLSDLTNLFRLPQAPNWTSTFLHEYIHFLQDITSTHGLLNFIHSIEHLKNANKQVAESSDAEFSIPLQMSNRHNWHTNTQLKSIYKGRDDSAKKVVYNRYREVQRNVATSDGRTLDVPQFYVDYFDAGAQTSMSCHFGAIHLKEFMAHTVQRQFDPSRDHDDIPYRLVELLVKKEIPRLMEDKAYVIALCDAALMDYHPANLFFHTIERMKNSPDWTPENVESVYAFTYQNLKPENFDSFDALFEKTADDAASHFHDAMKAEVFKSNVLWFKELIAGAKHLRIKRRGFFTRLIDSEGILSIEFKKVVSALGIPFTTNQHSKGTFIPPSKLAQSNINPYYPKVFQAVSKTYEGRCDCSLKPFCSAEPEKDITNEDCSRQPWARVNLQELCPYAQMWKTWGLIGKTPRLAGPPSK